MYIITLKAKYTNTDRNLIQINTDCETKYKFLAKLIYKWFIIKGNIILRYRILNSVYITGVSYDQCDTDNESYYHILYNYNYDNLIAFDIFVELKNLFK